MFPVKLDKKAGYVLRVAGYELRVASYGFRGTGCGVRVAGYGVRVTGYDARERCVYKRVQVFSISKLYLQTSTSRSIHIQLRTD